MKHANVPSSAQQAGQKKEVSEVPTQVQMRAGHPDWPQSQTRVVTSAGQVLSYKDALDWDHR